MKKASLFLVLTFVVVLALGFAGCAPPEEPVEPDPEEPVEPDPDVELVGVDFTLENVPEIENTTPIHVALEAGGGADLILPFLAEFQEHTGIEVTSEQMVFADLYSKVIVELQGGTGAYDLVVTETSWTNEWRDFLYPMRELAAEFDPGGVEEFEAYLEGHDPGMIRMASTLDEELMGIPYYNYTLIFIYREDVFEHPDEQEAFEEQYGYPLAPPTTWEEQRDLGEFFTRSAGETLKGEVLDDSIYGLSLMAGRYPHVQDEISTRLWGEGGRWARLVRDDDGNPEGFVITQEDMEILEWAFEDYHDSMQYAPPGARAAFWDMATAQFVEGNAVIIPHIYTGLWNWAASTEDEIEGAKVAAAPVVGERPYTGAFHFSPSIDSANPEAAYWLLKYIGARSTQREMAETGWVSARRDSVEDPEYQVEEWHHEFGWVEPTLHQWDQQYEDIDTYLHFNSDAFGKLYDEMTVIAHENAIGERTPAESVNLWIQSFNELQTRFGTLPVLDESLDSY